MKRLKVAVIGCGAIAQRRHLVEYANRNDVEIIAVVDINEKRAKQVADKFGAKHFTDIKKALALRPDLVSVCTPTAVHAAHSIAALKAGAHVLCEKPMAASVREAKAMIAAAKTARRQLMIGHNQRLHAAHVRGKQIYQSGDMGKCLGFKTTFAHKGPESWSVDGQNCHFFKKEHAVWGSLADLGVHKIDLVRWILEEDFVQVAAMSDTLEKKNCSVEDAAFMVLRTERGAIGKVFAGWMLKPYSDDSTVLYCQNGTLRLEDDPEYNVIADYSNRERQAYRTKGIQTNEAGGQYNTGVIDAFVTAVKTGKKVPIPAHDVLNSLATVAACAESAKSGKFVKVAK